MRPSDRAHACSRTYLESAGSRKGLLCYAGEPAKGQADFFGLGSAMSAPGPEQASHPGNFKEPTRKGESIRDPGAVREFLHGSSAVKAGRAGGVGSQFGTELPQWDTADEEAVKQAAVFSRWEMVALETGRTFVCAQSCQGFPCCLAWQQRQCLRQSGRFFGDSATDQEAVKPALASSRAAPVRSLKTWPAITSRSFLNAGGEKQKKAFGASQLCIVSVPCTEGMSFNS